MPGSVYSDHTSPQHPPRPARGQRHHHHPNHHSSRSPRAGGDQDRDRDYGHHRELRRRSPSPSSSSCSACSCPSDNHHRHDHRQECSSRGDSKAVAIVRESSSHRYPPRHRRGYDDGDDASSVEEYVIYPNHPPPRYPHPYAATRGRFDEEESKRRKKMKDRDRGFLLATVVFVASLVLCMD